MPSGNWSVPTSPRNPAKIREELRLLAALLPSWRLRGMAWGPSTGTQLEFGRALRQMPSQVAAQDSALVERDYLGQVKPSTVREEPSLPFQRQAEQLTDDNLRWTARARFGTYKFFGFIALDAGRIARFTPAGERLIHGPRPHEVFLRQLLKWQYPDHQHRGQRYPPDHFALFPFRAVAGLIRELDGLTKEEMGLFCFTMRRMEEVPAVAEAIARFRQTWGRVRGRVKRRQLAQQLLSAQRQEHAAAGLRVAASMDDYADALARYLRYTRLYSVRGARLVVASGREDDVDALLANPQVPFADYNDREAFYAHYGAAGTPRLPWEHPQQLQRTIHRLEERVATLQRREFLLRTGQVPRFGEPTGGRDDPPAPALPLQPQLFDCGGAAPETELDALWRKIDALQGEAARLEVAIDAVEARTPERLAAALRQYEPIVARRVIDPPTFLEWNTWRVFVSLNHAREIRPHLQLDSDLQPLGPAPGNGPDLVVTFDDYLLVVEVTLRRGADQRQHESRPVTRHVLDIQRRVQPRPVLALFLAPSIHSDTATDFFVALKYRVIEREQIAVIPLRIAQFIQIMQPFASDESPRPLDPATSLRALCEEFVAASLAAETGEEWLERIDEMVASWRSSLRGDDADDAMLPPSLRPLPLFDAAAALRRQEPAS